LTRYSNRGYPEILLKQCYEDLKNVNRYDILKPKKKLLLTHLRLHSPEILSQYDINIETIEECSILHKDKVFLVVPFYKNVWGISQIVRETIMECLHNCPQEYAHVTSSLKLIIAYKNTNALLRLLRN